MEERAALKESALPKTLSDHLKAHELIAGIQEEALSRLAEAGSRHLAKLSQGRYALRLSSGPEVTAARAEQDFFVVGAWKGDSVRSVRTRMSSDFVDELVRRPTARLVAPGPRHEIVTALCREAGATGKLVADAQHAAVAIEHGCTFVTTDGDFARFPRLRWQHPLGPA